MHKHYTQEDRLKAAQELANSITPGRPNGSQATASEKTGIPADTIRRWRKEASFKDLLKDAKRRRYEAMNRPGPDGESTLIKLKRARDLAAQRVFEEITEIHRDRLASTLEIIDRMIRLEEGMATEISETHMRMFRDYNSKSVDELRNEMRQKINEIPAAMQAVENPLAEDEMLESTEH